MYVLIQSFAEYDFIVKFHESELPFSAGRTHIHSTLECTGCVQAAYLQIDKDHHGMCLMFNLYLRHLS